MEFDDGRGFAGIVCEAAESAKKNTFALFFDKKTAFTRKMTKSYCRTLLIPKIIIIYNNAAFWS